MNWTKCWNSAKLSYVPLVNHLTWQISWGLYSTWTRMYFRQNVFNLSLKVPHLLDFTGNTPDSDTSAQNIDFELFWWVSKTVQPLQTLFSTISAGDMWYPTGGQYSVSLSCNSARTSDRILAAIHTELTALINTEEFSIFDVVHSVLEALCYSCWGRQSDVHMLSNCSAIPGLRIAVMFSRITSVSGHLSIQVPLTQSSSIDAYGM